MITKTHNKMVDKLERIRKTKTPNKMADKLERIRKTSDMQEKKEILLEGASPFMRRIIETSLASQKNNDKN